jgi:hypothetical protein
MWFAVTVPAAPPAFKQVKVKTLALLTVTVFTPTVIAAASEVTVTLNKSPVTIP